MPFQKSSVVMLSFCVCSSDAVVFLPRKKIKILFKSRKDCCWREENFKIFQCFLYMIQKQIRDNIQILYFWETAFKTNKQKPNHKSQHFLGLKRKKQMCFPFLCLILLTNTSLKTSVSGLCQLIMLKCKTVYGSTKNAKNLGMFHFNVMQLN